MTAMIVRPEQVNDGNGMGAQVRIIVLMLNDADAHAARDLLIDEAGRDFLNCVPQLLMHTHAINDAEGRAPLSAASLYCATSPARMQQPLSRREHEVLRLLAWGMRNKEIAEALFISERTVKWHVNSLFRKLDVMNRTEAARVAFQYGLVLIDESAVVVGQAVA